MQAVRVHEGGRLRYEQVDDPVAGPGEVLVELRAAALNRRDLLVRNPPGPAYTFPMPFVAGHDGAGIRRDTGAEVVLYPVVGWGDNDEVPDAGMRFLGGPLDGTFAELIAVPVENVFPKPPRLSLEEAACLPVAGLTAFRALALVGQLSAGETLLVLGAGSGVSTFAVSLGAQMGARVLVTSSSKDKIDRARALGAEGGVLYTQEGWVEEVRELTGGDGANVVLDSVGSTWPDSLRCLRRGGRLVVMGGTGGAQVELDVRYAYLNWLSILGTTLGSPRRVRSVSRDPAGGRLAAGDRQRSPLAEAAVAYEDLQGDHFGKLVVAP